MKKLLSILTVIGLSTEPMYGQIRNHMPVTIGNADYIGLPNTPGISKTVQNTFYVVKLSDFAKKPGNYNDKPTILRGVKVNFNNINSTCPVYDGLVAVDINAGTSQKYCYFMSKELYNNWKNKNQKTANIAFRGNTSVGYIIREIE